jgi:hypothetical protein
VRCVPTLGMGLTYPLVGPEALPMGVGVFSIYHARPCSGGHPIRRPCDPVSPYYRAPTYGLL